MGIKSDKTIYSLVEKHLRINNRPMTCANLMEIDEVRTEALNEFGGRDLDVRQATNKLSDLLGFMWRRGVLTRFPAPVTEKSLARYAYEWTDKTQVPAKPVPSPALSRFVGKSAITIQELEDGSVQIEFDKFHMVIKPK